MPERRRPIVRCAGGPHNAERSSWLPPRTPFTPHLTPDHPPAGLRGLAGGARRPGGRLPGRGHRPAGPARLAGGNAARVPVALPRRPAAGTWVPPPAAYPAVCCLFAVPRVGCSRPPLAPRTRMPCCAAAAGLGASPHPLCSAPPPSRPPPIPFSPAASEQDPQRSLAELRLAEAQHLLTATLGLPAAAVPGPLRRCPALAARPPDSEAVAALQVCCRVCCCPPGCRAPCLCFLPGRRGNVLPLSCQGLVVHEACVPAAVCQLLVFPTAAPTAAAPAPLRPAPLLPLVCSQALFGGRAELAHAALRSPGLLLLSPSRVCGWGPAC